MTSMTGKKVPAAPRVLIAAEGGIGDVLMTTPMFRAIKEKYPDAFLGVAVSGSMKMRLLERNKRIDYLFDISSLRKAMEFWRLVFHLKRLKFDYYFMNHNCMGRKYFLLPFLAGIKKRIGYSWENLPHKTHNRYYSKLLTTSVLYVVGDRRRTEKNLDLLREIGIRDCNYDYELFFPGIKGKGKAAVPVVGMHPGCGDVKKVGTLKRWQPEKFCQLAEKIAANLDFSVRIYLGPDETDLETYFKGTQKVEIIKKNDILETIDDMAACRYFISNDSGLAHIAGALKLPTVVIHGPTIPNEYVLPTRYETAEVELGCRPCYHLREPCRAVRPAECLESLGVEKVYNSLLRLCRENNTPSQK